MNCQSVRPLLSEFADERLDVATAWQVQTHLSDCADCAKVRHDLISVKSLLQTLPARQPSARFDDALAQRLALTRRPAAPPQTWGSRFARTFSLQRSPAVGRLRPALALGLVLVAGTVAAFFPTSPVQTPAPLAVRSADHAFVADCVAQHHRDAAAEPLADLSAQTLAGSLDGSAQADSPAPADPATDAGLF